MLRCSILRVRKNTMPTAAPLSIVAAAVLARVVSCEEGETEPATEKIRKKEGQAQERESRSDVSARFAPAAARRTREEKRYS
ncbi:hypothetical protein MRX96_056024 [Rhipicephalus microplus]